LGVEEIDKPACHWCKAVEWRGCGGRCGIYHERPDACRTFECIWLQSQVRTPQNGYPRGQVLPPALRPDRCHIVFCQDAYLNGAVDPGERRMVLFVEPEYPQAWREPLPMQQINGFLARGGVVEIIIGADKITLKKGTGKRIIEHVDPYLGMLRREVSFPGKPEFTLDAAELMRRMPNG
jgi:hypothetical protein